MKLKIVSDGTSLGTHVVNSKTGEEVLNVTSIQWNIPGGAFTSNATISLVWVEMDAEGELEEVEDDED